LESCNKGYKKCQGIQDEGELLAEPRLESKQRNTQISREVAQVEIVQTEAVAPVRVITAGGKRVISAYASKH